MRTVYHALNPIDAHLVRHALEDAGIPVFVFGEHLMGGMGELPVAGFIEVRVPDDWFEEARDVLEARQAGIDAAADASDADGEEAAGEGWLRA